MTSINHVIVIPGLGNVFGIFGDGPCFCCCNNPKAIQFLFSLYPFISTECPPLAGGPQMDVKNSAPTLGSRENLLPTRDYTAYLRG